MSTTTVPTPVGDLLVVTDDAGAVLLCTFADHAARMADRHGIDAAALATVAPLGPARPVSDSAPLAARALADYVAGDRTALDDLVVAARGTAFQRSVWDELRRIPLGETRSYGDLAHALGNPGAVRAVGQANGANPVWVIVPCHRVVRSGGALGGYGGGIERKAWLLEHEAQLLEHEAQLLEHEGTHFTL